MRYFPEPPRRYRLTRLCTSNQVRALFRRQLDEGIHLDALVERSVGNAVNVGAELASADDFLRYLRFAFSGCLGGFAGKITGLRPAGKIADAAAVLYFIANFLLAVFSLWQRNYGREDF
ncbi:hypothetical protein [Rhizobium miluonense]|uniref:Uncharacterized protein n=1 Tax=Rhizobium miluonense TaxID=411945 RepID=A0A1C3XA06_9HYPH|nr:hypothetical protein [Rhizobium miluonense]SCB49107.1 hypothetical protein GA0061102_107116 [Rhizobium miluonense]